MRIHGLLLAAETPRFAEARLRLIIDTLPAAVVLNPLWTAILFLPFLSAPNVFGHVPVSHLIAATGLQLLLAIPSAALWLRLREGRRSLLPYRRRMLGLQIALSCGWGAMLWLFSSGETVNTLYVCMIYVSVAWAIVFTRTAHRMISFAGFLPVTAIFAARLFTLGGQAALVILALLPWWTAYIWLMGARGRKAIDGALEAQFANEDLSAALGVSNAEAQRGRLEAETANAAKTVFLANMSHELRTPLNAILGFSDIIAHRSLGDDQLERYAEYAADIHASGSHLLALINDLLDVAKIESGKMEIDPHPLDAGLILYDLERLMASRTAPRRQTLICTVEAGLPALFADERAFRQIALNLLSNAVKFTPEGGHIAMALRRSAEGLLFDVVDDGPGIPQEKIARVFEPFSQIDNRYGRQTGGTGLGLALVRGLVELHGGQVWIESVLGHGTRVCVYFPLADGIVDMPKVAAG
ncbi:MAG: HAMP domain-containing histidine kinase [Proteobacteria bacterium]|nr:HAMP domain-containing histidine kinase [Pseudomonadota bacterium]